MLPPSVVVQSFVVTLQIQKSYPGTKKGKKADSDLTTKGGKVLCGIAPKPFSAKLFRLRFSFTKSLSRHPLLKILPPTIR